MGIRVQKLRHLSDCWTWTQMMKICCFDLEIRVIMLPRNIKHADRHNFESHRSKSRRVWPCSASSWFQISLAKILRLSACMGDRLGRGRRRRKNCSVNIKNWPIIFNCRGTLNAIPCASRQKLFTAVAAAERRTLGSGQDPRFTVIGVFYFGVFEASRSGV